MAIDTNIPLLQQSEFGSTKINPADHLGRMIQPRVICSKVSARSDFSPIKVIRTEHFARTISLRVDDVNASRLSDFEVLGSFSQVGEITN